MTEPQPEIRINTYQKDITPILPEEIEEPPEEEPEE